MANSEHKNGGKGQGGATGGRPLTGERLRDILVMSVGEHPDVVACRSTETFYTDRFALLVVDSARRGWVVHVLDTPRAGVVTNVQTITPPRRGGN